MGGEDPKGRIHVVRAMILGLRVGKGEEEWEQKPDGQTSSQHVRPFQNPFKFKAAKLAAATPVALGTAL